MGFNDDQYESAIPKRRESGWIGHKWAILSFNKDICQYCETTIGLGDLSKQQEHCEVRAKQEKQKVDGYDEEVMGNLEEYMTARQVAAKMLKCLSIDRIKQITINKKEIAALYSQIPALKEFIDINEP